jgi:hypothetical protein
MWRSCNLTGPLKKSPTPFVGGICIVYMERFCDLALDDTPAQRYNERSYSILFQHT